MDRIRRSAYAAVAAIALLAPAGQAQAQPGADDGIARNLLERQQRELEFGVSLYDDGPLSTTQPARPAPPSLPPAAERSRLYNSQQQRLMGLQSQNRDLPPPVRTQQFETQQLQFGRENRAEALHDRIQRDSERSMQLIR